MSLRNGVFSYVKEGHEDVALTITVPAAALGALAAGAIDAATASGLVTDGDEKQLQSLFSVLDPGNPSFNIIEP
jgi:alkyl sulfatase BDS1-like metallo-beta-lactamase superfamily hydrolase